MKKYRKGPLGALMDEYERAAEDYFRTIEKIPDDIFVKILDTQTKDEDCRSIQSICSHVLGSGIYYSNMIRKHFNETITLKPTKNPAPLNAQLTKTETLKMLAYASESLENKLDISDKDLGNYLMKSRWGTIYDIEQLMEHAVLHIMRHRRQIERLSLKSVNI